MEEPTFIIDTVHIPDVADPAVGLRHGRRWKKEAKKEEEKEYKIQVNSIFKMTIQNKARKFTAKNSFKV